jgi:hypothetical protein
LSVFVGTLSDHFGTIVFDLEPISTISASFWLPLGSYFFLFASYSFPPSFELELDRFGLRVRESVRSRLGLRYAWRLKLRNNNNYVYLYG